MPFATVAVPFDSYRALPSAQHRWLLICLARYADRQGRCWPSMRQLAQDARMSLASVCRYLRSMAELGVFQRKRQGVGRYHYALGTTHIPSWRARVPPAERRVPQDEKQQASPQSKGKAIVDFVGQDDALKWEARLRGWHKRKLWLPFWGPKPNEPGCWAPGLA